MQYHTGDLITQVKQRETVPDSGVAYSDSVILDFLNQSLFGFIVPAIQLVMEEYFVVSMDFQMPTQPGYNGTTPPVNVGNAINIPSESTGMRLRDVYLIANNGSFYNLARLTPSQAASQNFGNVNWSMAYNNQTAAAGGFFLQGNQLQIFPYGLASDKIIRLTYRRSPLDMCLASDAGKVVNITGDVVTMDKVLPWFANITEVCAISGDFPHDFVEDTSIPTTVYTSPAPLSNMTVIGVAGNVVTLPAGKGANIKKGDWLSQSHQSPFAMNIPKEMMPVLTQKAAEMVLESAGDREGQVAANETFRAMLQASLTMITPRVPGKMIKLLPTNSVFRASRGFVYGVR